MRIRYYYYLSNHGEKVDGHEPSLWSSCDTGEPRKDEWFARDAKFSPQEWGQIALARPYSTYLCSAIQTDFPAHQSELIDAVLKDIEKLERGEIDKCFAGTADTFCHSLTRYSVTFEHAIFGVCPEWPLWSCPLAHYKTALQGWRKFIDMPKSLGSELIVELPDVTV